MCTWKDAGEKSEMSDDRGAVNSLEKSGTWISGSENHRTTHHPEHHRTTQSPSPPDKRDQLWGGHKAGEDWQLRREVSRHDPDLNFEEIKGERRELHSWAPLVNWKHHPGQTSCGVDSSVPGNTELSSDWMLVSGWLAGWYHMGV